MSITLPALQVGERDLVKLHRMSTSMMAEERAENLEMSPLLYKYVLGELLTAILINQFASVAAQAARAGLYVDVGTATRGALGVAVEIELEGKGSPLVRELFPRIFDVLVHLELTESMIADAYQTLFRAYSQLCDNKDGDRQTSSALEYMLVPSRASARQIFMYMSTADLQAKELLETLSQLAAASQEEEDGFRRKESAQEIECHESATEEAQSMPTDQHTIDLGNRQGTLSSLLLKGGLIKIVVDGYSTVDDVRSYIIEGSLLKQLKRMPGLLSGRQIQVTSESQGENLLTAPMNQEYELCLNEIPASVWEVDVDLWYVMKKVKPVKGEQSAPVGIFYYFNARSEAEDFVRMRIQVNRSPSHKELALENFLSDSMFNAFNKKVRDEKNLAYYYEQGMDVSETSLYHEFKIHTDRRAFEALACIVEFLQEWAAKPPESNKFYKELKDFVDSHNTVQTGEGSDTLKIMQGRFHTNTASLVRDQVRKLTPQDIQSHVDVRNTHTHTHTHFIHTVYTHTHTHIVWAEIIEEV